MLLRTGWQAHHAARLDRQLEQTDCEAHVVKGRYAAPQLRLPGRRRQQRSPHPCGRHQPDLRQPLSGRGEAIHTLSLHLLPQQQRRKHLLCRLHQGSTLYLHRAQRRTAHPCSRLCDHQARTQRPAPATRTRRRLLLYGGHRHAVGRRLAVEQRHRHDAVKRPRQLGAPHRQFSHTLRRHRFRQCDTRVGTRGHLGRRGTKVYGLLLAARRRHRQHLRQGVPLLCQQRLL